MPKCLRRVAMQGIHNIRDIGGYPVGFDKMVAWGKLYRSDGLYQLASFDVKRLMGIYKVNTVIDLRTQEECHLMPNTFADNQSVAYHHISLFDIANITEKDNLTSLKQLYLFIAQNGREGIGRVINIIAESLNNQTAVVYHCTAGKDRTGMITALLLLLCGVQKFDIIADYEISYTLLCADLSRISSADQPVQMHQLRSNPENIISFLDYIEGECCGIIGFLTKCGVQERVLNGLREALITEV